MNFIAQTFFILAGMDYGHLGDAIHNEEEDEE